MSCKPSQQYYVCAKARYHGCCEVDPCSTGFCLFDSDSDTDAGGDTGGSGGDVDGGDGGNSTPSDLFNGPLETEISPGIALATTTMTMTRMTASAATAFTARPSTIQTHVLMTKSSTSPLSTTETLPATTMSSPTSSPTDKTSSPTSSPAEENASSSTVPGFSSDDSNSSSSSNSKGAIGGAVAGGVALAILLALIFLFCSRSRRKQNRRFTLLRWYGPQYSPRLRGYGRGKTAGSGGSGHAEGGCKCGTHSNCCGRKGGGGQAYTTPYNIDTTPSQPQNQPQNHNPVTPTNTSPNLDAPNSTSRLLPRTTQSITSSPEKQPYKNQQHYTIPSHLSPPPLFTLIPLTKTIDPIRSRVSPTPELGDTGFYRQRAELAAYSQSELINIPQGERMRRYQPQQQVQPQLQPQPYQQKQPQQQETQNHNKNHIITPEGAVLAANFERFPGCQDHATSFTQCYDGSRCSGLRVNYEDELPGYYPMDDDADMNGDGNVSVDEKDVGVGGNGNGHVQG